jgi:hypothetical protein
MSAATISTVESLVAEISSYYPTSPHTLEAACWADDLKSSAAPQESVRVSSGVRAFLRLTVSHTLPALTFPPVLAELALYRPCVKDEGKGRPC